MLSPNATSLSYSNFRDLKVGDTVFSKQLGEGKITQLYEKDQVIIRFGDHRMRLSIDDHRDLMQVPKSPKAHQQGIRIQSGGVSLSLRKFKRQEKAIIDNEYIAVSKAARMIGISKAKLERRINQRRIEVSFIAGVSRIPLSSIYILSSNK